MTARLAVASLLLVWTAGGTAPASAGGTATVELTVRHSRFSPSALVVPHGTTVRFVVHNADPIAHELIIGDAGLHARHEGGTERWHPPRPGEVSVDIASVAETAFTFDRPGTVRFGCHLPGHWAYGMQGTVRVV